MVEQYTKLWDYCEEICRTNPGSTAFMHFKQDCNGIPIYRFQRIYICWEALKRGFIEGCRPLISVDGCHLKGPYGGQLLAGNNQIFPVAYAVVDIENTTTWIWFINLLVGDLQIQDAPTFTIMSDKQKGLGNAIKKLLPMVEHKHCMRHMHNNMKTMGFTSQATKDRLWNMARASYVGQFQGEMKALKTEDPDAWEWLADKDPRHWSRLHFNTSSKCDILLNNICEAFNKVILDARDKPILTMLERIRKYLMDRLVKRRGLPNKWNGDIGSKIHKILEKKKTNASAYVVALAGDDRFEVRGMHGDQFAVDLGLWTCSCKRWDLTGIPCQHAISVIWESMKQLEHYVDHSYSISTFTQAYRNGMYLLNGTDMWEKRDMPPIKPPDYTKKSGRPKKSRIIERDEQPKANNGKKLRRYLKHLSCRRCGEKGHNVRTCKVGFTSLRSNGGPSTL